MEKQRGRYFVAKVATIQDLRRCSETNKWACRDRASPPQPADILKEAFTNGPVILLFSVNNCHGWHGYAEMVSAPSEADCCDTDGGSTRTEQQSNHEWRYFTIAWKVIYIREFGECCLHSSETESLNDLTGSPVNKARNWEELPVETGERLCHLMEWFYNNLCSKREEKLRTQLENVPAPFYKTESQSSNQTWKEIVRKVEQDLGKVILACPFGSQRYNLSVPASDTDMFIVYQAKTSEVLGFHPPKQTIKNSDTQSVDYTIHEIFRFAELLLSGDPRCVETLFLYPSSLICGSPEYDVLITGRKKFLHRKTLDKYLRDAQGTHGTKLLRKWCNEHESETVLPPKMCKLLYVIVRLLQNARDIVNGEQIKVFREDGCKDRDELMLIRQGNVLVHKAWEIIDRLENVISQNVDKVPLKSDDVDKFLEEWLLKLRYSDFDQSRCS